MPIRRRQKKPNVEPQQKPKHSHAVVDPMVNPGSPAHRRQARSKADPARPHLRMVTLAQSSPSDRSARAFQSKKPTVMLRRPLPSSAAPARSDDEGICCEAEWQDCAAAPDQTGLGPGPGIEGQELSGH